MAVESERPCGQSGVRKSVTAPRRFGIDSSMRTRRPSAAQAAETLTLPLAPATRASLRDSLVAATVNGAWKLRAGAVQRRASTANANDPDCHEGSFYRRPCHC